MPTPEALIAMLGAAALGTLRPDGAIASPTSSEDRILATAAALGAALPLFRESDAPELFAGWRDRILLAANTRDRGQDHVAAVDEANRHIGRPTRPTLKTVAAAPDPAWLEKLAAPVVPSAQAVAL